MTTKHRKGVCVCDGTRTLQGFLEARKQMGSHWWEQGKVNCLQTEKQLFPREPWEARERPRKLKKPCLGKRAVTPGELLSIQKGHRWLGSRPLWKTQECGSITKPHGELVLSLNPQGLTYWPLATEPESLWICWNFLQLSILPSTSPCSTSKVLLDGFRMFWVYSSDFLNTFPNLG